MTTWSAVSTGTATWTVDTSGMGWFNPPGWLVSGWFVYPWTAVATGSTVWTIFPVVTSTTPAPIFAGMPMGILAGITYDADST